MKETYWNSVRYADTLTGMLVDRLKDLGIYDNTIVIISADHGESLFDDGFLGHGHFINKQQLNIPLVINKPDIALKDPIGLSDYYDLITALISDKEAQEAVEENFVFQHVGDIDRPYSIGLVEPDDKLVKLTFKSLDVYFSELNKTIHLHDIQSPELKKRADRLINRWAQIRWEKHLLDKDLQD